MGKVLKTFDMDKTDEFSEDEWIILAAFFHRDPDEEFKAWVKETFGGTEIEIRAEDSEYGRTDSGVD